MRVGPDTEEKFDDDFWNGMDVIVACSPMLQNMLVAKFDGQKMRGSIPPLVKIECSDLDDKKFSRVDVMTAPCS